MNPNLKHPRAFTVAIALIDYAHRFDNIFEAAGYEVEGIHLQRYCA